MKARQKGFSSYILADQFIDCVRKPTNAMVISHEKEATKRLFGKIKYYIDNLEIKPAIKYETKQDISFPKTNSNYYIGTAGQKAVGRGDTIHRVHFSEVAYFEKPENSISGVKEAVPMNGKIIIESTANGRGNWFYDEWQKAKNGESIYTPHFVPWFIDNEYRIDSLESLKVPAEIKEKIGNPRLSEEEKELVEKYNLTLAQIRWRRYKIWDLGIMFHQEYPENDVDCFLQSGRPVFKVVGMTEKSDLQKDKRYLGGLDGAEGIQGGDNHCFALIDVDVKPAKVAFEIVSNEPIEIFDQRVANICHKFKIRLGVEKNGIGVAHCQKLRELGVVFEEWQTTTATRPLLIVELEEAYRKDYLKESYLEAKNELLDMFYDDKNRPCHRSGKHDDRIFARGVAWQMRKVARPDVTFI